MANSVGASVFEGLMSSVSSKYSTRISRVLRKRETLLRKEDKKRGVRKDLATTASIRTSTYDRFLSEWQQSSARKALYNTMKRMYEECEIVSSGIDSNADATLGVEEYNSDETDKDYTEVLFREAPKGIDPASVTEYIDDQFDRGGVYGILPLITREVQIYGDFFGQFITNAGSPRQSEAPGLYELQPILSWTMWPKRDPQMGHHLPGFIYNDGVDRKEYGRGQIVHFVFQRNRFGYGTPLMYPARYTWTRLQANEEAISVDRFRRAHPTVIHNIPVQDEADPDEQAQAIQFYRDMNTTGHLHETSRGTISEFRAPESLPSDIYNPITVIRKPDDTISTYGGTITPLEFTTPQLANLTDMEWAQDKILARLGTPRRFINMSDNRAGALTESGLELQDMNFARKIRDVQRTLKGDNDHGLRHLVNLLLIDKYGSYSDFDFVINMTKVSVHDERDRVAIQAVQANTIATIARTPPGRLPLRWIMREIYNQTDEQWEELRQMQFEEMDDLAVIIEIAAEALGQLQGTVEESFDTNSRGGTLPDPLQGVQPDGLISSRSKDIVSANRQQADESAQLVRLLTDAGADEILIQAATALHPTTLGAFVGAGVAHVGAKEMGGELDVSSGRGNGESALVVANRKRSARRRRYARSKARSGDLSRDVKRDRGGNSTNTGIGTNVIGGV